MGLSHCPSETMPRPRQEGRECIALGFLADLTMSEPLSCGGSQPRLPSSGWGQGSLTSRRSLGCACTLQSPVLAVTPGGAPTCWGLSGASTSHPPQGGATPEWSTRAGPGVEELSEGLLASSRPSGGRNATEERKGRKGRCECEGSQLGEPCVLVPKPVHQTGRSLGLGWSSLCPGGGGGAGRQGRGSAKKKPGSQDPGNRPPERPGAPLSSAHTNRSRRGQDTGRRPTDPSQPPRKVGPVLLCTGGNRGTPRSRRQRWSRGPAVR